MQTISTYDPKVDEFFIKVKDKNGILSNMYNDCPLIVSTQDDTDFLPSSHKIQTSEALYQVCRYPDYPEIQQEIILEKSPISAKMKSKKYRKHTRQDWETVCIPIMEWCLRKKLDQHFEKIYKALTATGNKQIFEWSHKDIFWGAVSDRKRNPNILITGQNVLGKLWMKIRQELYVNSAKLPSISLQLFHNNVMIPKISNFKLFDKNIIS